MTIRQRLKAHPALFRLRSLCLVFAICISCSQQTFAQETKDSDNLGMAIDYFQSGKYHEALLLFCQLDAKYNLNPRFKAYMGLCYYHDGDYKNACKTLDECLAKLGNLSKQELTVYIFTSAESHFMLGEYDLAIPKYEGMLLICHDNEKADAYFRLGFCYMEREKWASAHDSFSSALAYYSHFGCAKDKQQRLEQLKNMIAGCREKI